MESSAIVRLRLRGRGSPRKIIGQTINKDLDLNDFSLDMIYHRTLWCYFIT